MTLYSLILFWCINIFIYNIKTFSHQMKKYNKNTHTQNYTPSYTQIRRLHPTGNMLV